jgi:hypothetical protein
MWNLGLLGAMGARIGDFELIASTTLSSSEPAVTFNNLDVWSSTYKHLQLRIVGRTDRTDQPGDVLLVRLNGDSGSNYAWHYLSGNSVSVVSANGTSQTEMWLWRLGGSTNIANSFGAIVVDILDPYTTKNKTVRALSGMTGSLNEIFLGSGLWNSTASLTGINLDQIGSNFTSGSRFSLYGIRG